MLKEYFSAQEGIGVLATADSSGAVDAAIYAKPHFFEDGTVAFLMADRLSHQNVQSNPSAVYLFVEQGSWQGKRLHLTKVREETDPSLIESLRKHQSPPSGPVYLVYFKIDKVRPLTGE